MNCPSSFTLKESNPSSVDRSNQGLRTEDATRMDLASEPEVFDGQVCDICGDAGYEKLLAVCTLCGEGAEHVYCMQKRLEEVPEAWVCEACKTGQRENPPQQTEQPAAQSAAHVGMRPASVVTGRKGSGLGNVRSRIGARLEKKTFGRRAVKGVPGTQALPTKRPMEEAITGPPYKRSAVEGTSTSTILKGVDELQGSVKRPGGESTPGSAKRSVDDFRCPVSPHPLSLDGQLKRPMDETSAGPAPKRAAVGSSSSPVPGGFHVRTLQRENSSKSMESKVKFITPLVSVGMAGGITSGARSGVKSGGHDAPVLPSPRSTLRQSSYRVGDLSGPSASNDGENSRSAKTEGMTGVIRSTSTLSSPSQQASSGTKAVGSMKSAGEGIPSFLLSTKADMQWKGDVALNRSKEGSREAAQSQASSRLAPVGHVRGATDVSSAIASAKLAKGVSNRSISHPGVEQKARADTPRLLAPFNGANQPAEKVTKKMARSSSELSTRKDSDDQKLGSSTNPSTTPTMEKHEQGAATFVRKHQDRIPNDEAGNAASGHISAVTPQSRVPDDHRSRQDMDASTSSHAHTPQPPGTLPLCKNTMNLNGSIDLNLPDESIASMPEQAEAELALPADDQGYKGRGAQVKPQSETTNTGLSSSCSLVEGLANYGSQAKPLDLPSQAKPSPTDNSSVKLEEDKGQKLQVDSTPETNSGNVTGAQRGRKRDWLDLNVKAESTDFDDEDVVGADLQLASTQRMQVSTVPGTSSKGGLTEDLLKHLEVTNPAGITGELPSTTSSSLPVGQDTAEDKTSLDESQPDQLLSRWKAFSSAAKEAQRSSPQELTGSPWQRELRQTVVKESDKSTPSLQDVSPQHALPKVSSVGETSLPKVVTSNVSAWPVPAEGANEDHLSFQRLGFQRLRQHSQQLQAGVEDSSSGAVSLQRPGQHVQPLDSGAEDRSSGRLNTQMPGQQAERLDAGTEDGSSGRLNLPRPGRQPPQSQSDAGAQGRQTPASPSNIVWRGRFTVLVMGEAARSYGTIDAYISSKAVPRVREVAMHLPNVLQFEEARRGVDIDSWPRQFQRQLPSDDSIAFYFFPSNVESSQIGYKQLVQHMESRDLVLRGAVVEGADLFVLPSRWLPVQQQQSCDYPFLWGVFRARKSRSPPSGSARTSAVEEARPSGAHAYNAHAHNAIRAASISSSGNLHASDMEVEGPCSPRGSPPLPSEPPPDPPPPPPADL